MSESSSSCPESLQEKMCRAWRMAMTLDLEPLPPPLEEHVSAWQDGLWHKYLAERLAGRCSLADSLAFDLAEFETTIDDQLRQLEHAVRHFPARSQDSHI